MTLIAKYPEQCANCGRRINPGDEVNFIKASGDFPPRTEHVECPPPKQKKPPTFVDFDKLFIIRQCDNCGHEWAHRRHWASASSPEFVCHLCLREERKAAA